MVGDDAARNQTSGGVMNIAPCEYCKRDVQVIGAVSCCGCGAPLRVAQPYQPLRLSEPEFYQSALPGSTYSSAYMSSCLVYGGGGHHDG